MSKDFNYRGVWIYPVALSMRCDDPEQPHPKAETRWWSCELSADGAAAKVRTRPLATLEAAKDAAKSWVDAMYVNIGIHEAKFTRKNLEEFGEFVRDIDAGDGDVAEIDEMVDFFLGERETARKSSKMVVEDCFCDHCKKITPHEIFDQGHERDSSYDRHTCLRCRWSWVGMTGKYEPPSE